MQNTIVPDYEVFQNDNNAVAFFMYRHPSLDALTDQGPYYFAIHNNDKIVAGTEENHAIFLNLKPDIIDTVRERGVIMLVEFENQKPLRCTPCYLSKNSQ